MTRDSLIFMPTGGAGYFADIAERMRRADDPPNLSRVLAVPYSLTEWINVEATHLGLHAMDTRGYFQPIVLIPLLPFTDQPRTGILRSPALFRLAWHGHPPGTGLISTSRAPDTRPTPVA